jgi:hypothetical protein
VNPLDSTISPATTRTAPARHRPGPSGATGRVPSGAPAPEAAVRFRHRRIPRPAPPTSASPPGTRPRADCGTGRPPGARSRGQQLPWEARVEEGEALPLVHQQGVRVLDGEGPARPAAHALRGRPALVREPGERQPGRLVLGAEQGQGVQQGRRPHRRAAGQHVRAEQGHQRGPRADVTEAGLLPRKCFPARVPRLPGACPRGRAFARVSALSGGITAADRRWITSRPGQSSCHDASCPC